MFFFQNLHCIKIYLVIKNSLNSFYYNLEIVFYNKGRKHFVIKIELDNKSI